MISRRDILAIAGSSLLHLPSLISQATAGNSEPVSSNALALLGDSRTAVTTFDAATNNIQQTALSPFVWMNALNDQCWRLTGNFGRAGETTTQILTRLAAALATRPAFLSIWGGVNDPRKGLTADDTWNNLQNMALAALAHNIRPIMFTDPGAAGFNGAQCRAFHGAGGLNDRIRKFCADHPRAVLVDLAPALLSSRDPIVFKDAYSYDGVHLTSVGAYFASLVLARAAKQVIGAAAHVDHKGNLLSNADFTLAEGGATGAGTTGILPQSWGSVRDSADIVSARFSLNTRRDGQKELIVACASDAASRMGGARVRQNIADINPGDIIQAGCQIDVDGGYSNLCDVYCECDINFSDGTFLQGYDFASSTSGGKYPDIGAFSLTLKTAPINIPSNKSIKSAQFFSRIRVIGNGHGTMRVRMPWVMRMT
jgi:lysophospholipase L1-like esterase